MSTASTHVLHQHLQHVPPLAVGGQGVYLIDAQSKRRIDASGGAERVIAFVAKAMGGATAGVLAPVPGYFKAVREVCNRHGV